MAGSAQPTVSTPAWRTSAGTPIAARLTPEVGRGYYFQGDYRSAIDAYQTYLATNAAAGPRAREELAWVYTEAGDRGKATQEYRQALGEYQSDLARGHNTEAARHGVRTCRSALRVLESR
jgi:tetratricopeptide (TPR) repeat protein